MDKLQKEKDKIKSEARNVRKQSLDNIKKEIEENYKIGIEYYQNIEENED